MFGQNTKLPTVKGDGTVLSIKSIFKTLQGEGPYVGKPAIFIRLGGCNLACSFCDTEFDDFALQPLSYITREVEKLCLNRDGKKSVFFVVITGGEPFRQPIFLLCRTLLDLGFLVQIETNGTLYQEIPAEVKIICSPKITKGKYHRIREDLLPGISAFKYLVSSSLPGYNEVPDLGQSIYNIPVYVQGMDEYDRQKNLDNEKLAVSLALEHGYILSYQLHKVLGLP